MKRNIASVLAGSALVVFGWTTGTAQTPSRASDFAIAIESPPIGQTTVTCVRGCELLLGTQSPTGNNGASDSVSYPCSGPSRCSVNEIAGWLTGPPSQLVAQADFEIQVSNPTGDVTITCVRGCGLQFTRYLADRYGAQRSFTYGGAGASVRGWVIQPAN